MVMSHVERNENKFTPDFIKEEIAGFLREYKLDGNTKLYLPGKKSSAFNTTNHDPVSLERALRTQVHSLAYTLSGGRRVIPLDPEPATRLNEILEIVLPKDTERAFTSLFEVAQQTAHRSVSL